jgi:hypothetical protein
MAMDAAPRNDDLYECLLDTPVEFVTHWRAPYTGGGTGTLPKGTKVRILVDSAVYRPAAYYARPVDAETLSLVLIPHEERANPKFDGFSLVLTLDDLEKRFRHL